MVEYTSTVATSTAVAIAAVSPVTSSTEANTSAVELSAGGLQNSSAATEKPAIEQPVALPNLDVVGSIEQELEQVSAIYQMVVEFFVGYSFQIVGALIILLLGTVLARKISKMVERFCLGKNLDVTLSSFIGSTVKIIIVIMIAIIALGKIGVSVTPFLAAIGALSLGAGLAMQGLLANYAAGLNIILTRPFVVGDTIAVQAVSGLVKTVHLAYTILIDEDGTEITIPNRHIVGEIIHNSYSNMLAELSIGIAYSEDAPRVIEIVRQALARVDELQHIQMPVDAQGVPRTEQRIQVGIGGFGDSSVNLSVRVWLPTAQFYRLRFKANAAIYAALNEQGVKIPFPQQEVRVLNSDFDERLDK